MTLPTRALLTLCIVLSGAAAAHAQTQAPAAGDKDKWTLQPLLPPHLLLPPSTQLNSGTLQTPTTSAPLQSPAQTQTPSNPGIKLTIPSR